ncbi:MAG: bifunctional nuclease family protein [Coriobacteriales bacterium]|jgi:bifunctional DNase/RNase|nr:bifunctional nuclease family protein [Coriobacteriales bacterium]
MVSVKIETLIIGIPPSPSVIVLRPQGDGPTGDRVLPIWIGPAEATSIGVALEGRTHERPMTHDLLVNTISALGAKVERVVVDRVADTTFFATVYLSRDGRTINMDARPSDSIALAVRAVAPLYVDEDVLNSSSHSYNFNTAGRTKEATVDEFRSFLDSLSPEDFQVSE